MRKLYCFDFDGTLTRKDTMFLYLKFYDAAKYRIQFVKHIPLFILLKLKLADAEKVKKNLAELPVNNANACTPGGGCC